jgi:hypothetical protein
MYVEAQLSECDRVQQAFHSSLQQFTDAKIAAATADIRRGADLARQHGDELIAMERVRVSDSLNRLQAHVAQGLPQLEDKGAFVTEMMGERCHPWFSLDVAHAATNHVDVFRTDVAAPASLLLSVLQPQQLQRPSIPIHVMAGIFYRNGNHDAFSFQLSSSDTVAHLKLQIEKKTGIARNRLLVIGCCYGGSELQPHDEDELETLRNCFGEVKMHVKVDHPDQVVTV